MLMPIFSGLIVSIDAFFIGISLGLQERCKFMYLVIINAFLMGMCILGFFVASHIYAAIPIDPDIVVGFAFIGLGMWTILQYFVCRHDKKGKKSDHSSGTSLKTFVLVGVVMSFEAMLITMGITMIFLPSSTLAIPLMVGLAHFGYSVLSFCIARSKYAKRIPVVLNHVISGIALIAYGVIALFVEIGIL